MQLTIDRKRWLRGTHPTSYLRRKRDGKMCCVGFYAKALGHTQDEITGQYELVNLKKPKCRWSDSDDMYNLYNVNDACGINEAEREVQIIRGFKRHRVNVRFIN